MAALTPEEKAERVRTQKRDSALRIKFGITEEEYQKILKAQKGVCWLCGRRPGRTRRLAVDHDHRTGVIRGLLCDWCNRNRLGRGREDVEMVRRVLAYLEQGPVIVANLLGREVVVPRKKRVSRRKSAVRTRTKG